MSVYITNYNYGKYIREAIESVLNQSMKDFELIIIDDGSTDDSKSIIEEYANHPNVRIVYQQNKGLNISNNVALHLAHGKYLIRLDADDYFDKDALKLLSDELDNDDELGLVFPDYYIVDNHNLVVSEIKRHDFGKDVTLFDQPAHGACTMVRIDFLKKVGGYYESFKCQDGYDLWIKFISDYKVSNVKQSLFYYRQHGNNLTKNENMLLKTRSEIKKKFIETRKKALPATIGIIPVRSYVSNKLSLEKLGGKTLLEIKIETALRSELLKKVVVVYSDEFIYEQMATKFTDAKLVFIKRPEEFSRYNSTLYDTISLIFNSDPVKNLGIESFVLLSLEFPFTKPEMIDNIIRSSVIFQSDSVISTRESLYSLYKHNGQTMVPLDDKSLTKYERESIYLSLGGLSYSTYKNLQKHKVLPAGKISHVIVDQISAMEMRTVLDIKLAEYILESNLYENLESTKLHA